MRKITSVTALVIIALGILCVPSAVLADTHVVDIVLGPQHFRPVQWPSDTTEASVPLTWTGCKEEDVMNRLNHDKPDAVSAVPAFRGREQLYGYLKLGNFKNNRFYFVMDVVAPNKMFMYFDRNKDGRLDNDGPPLEHQGHFDNPDDAGFAALVLVPWDELIVDAPFKGNFQVWFFINNSQWANKGFSHASYTFLAGTIDLNGVTRTVYFRDRFENDNDADLTDDGFSLKIAEGKTRQITRQEARDGVEIDGQVYKFNIAYGKGSSL